MRSADRVSRRPARLGIRLLQESAKKDRPIVVHTTSPRRLRVGKLDDAKKALGAAVQGEHPMTAPKMPRACCRDCARSMPSHPADAGGATRELSTNSAPSARSSPGVSRRPERHRPASRLRTDRHALPGVRAGHRPPGVMYAVDGNSDLDRAFKLATRARELTPGDARVTAALGSWRTAKPTTSGWPLAERGAPKMKDDADTAFYLGCAGSSQRTRPARRNR